MGSSFAYSIITRCTILEHKVAIFVCKMYLTVLLIIAFCT